jgi:hypothetical protein
MRLLMVTRKGFVPGPSRDAMTVIGLGRSSLSQSRGNRDIDVLEAKD